MTQKRADSESADTEAVGAPSSQTEQPDRPAVDDELLRPEWLERWRLKLARNAPLEQAYKIFVLFLGLTIMAAGLVMLVFPGPGWATIILGLVVLATEYRWAEKLLEPIRRFVHLLAERAKDPKARVQNLMLLALTALLAAAFAWWWIDRYGFTLEPLPFL